MRQMKHHEHHWAGYLCMILSSLAGAIIPTTVKGLSFFLSTVMIYFLTRLFSSVGLISLVFEKGKASLRTRNFLQIFWMTFFYNAATVYYFIAVSHIPLMNASLLFNTAPLYIPLIASWTIGEKISHKIWFGISISFVGVMLILQPGMDLFNPYALFAVVSGIFMACCQVLNRRLTAKEPASLLVTYLVLFSIFFSFLTVIFSDWKGDISRWLAQSDPWIWIGVLILSGLASWTFQILRTHAVRLTKVGLVMPFSYFGVLFVAISGWIFFKQVPDLYSIIGSCIVIVGCIFILRYRKT